MVLRGKRDRLADAMDLVGREDGALDASDWREVKVGLAGGWRQGHLGQPSYVAAREPAVAFARRLGTEAARRGALDVVQWHPWDGAPAELRPVVVLGDGAKWIWGARGHAVW